MVKLGECCTVVGGATPKREVPEYWNSPDVPWVTPKDISKLISPVLDDAPEYISMLGLKNCSASILPKGSILLTSRAPIGNVAIAGRDMCTNQGFKSLVPGANVDGLYLYYCMLAYSEKLKDLGNGATFKEVSKKVVEEFEIPLPPLAEQKRIAAILDQADAIRCKRKQAIKLADDFLRSVFLDMFGDPVTNPKGWDVKNFSDVCKCSQGIQVDSELQKDSGENGYVKFLRIINYTQSSKEFKFIPAPSTDKALINKDEIVMVRYGATAGFVGRGLDGILANNLFKISFEKSVLDNEYFYYLLNSDYFQNILRNNKKGGAMPAISFGQLNGIEIMAPSLEIQRKFARVVNMIKRTKEHSLHSESLSNDSFNSLSQKAFAGEL